MVTLLLSCLMTIKLLLLKLTNGLVFEDIGKPNWPAVTPAHLRND